MSTVPVTPTKRSSRTHQAGQSTTIESRTRTWTKTTTAITDTISRTTTPSSSPQKNSSFANTSSPRTPGPAPSTPPPGLRSHVPKIPHPDEIQAPEPGFNPEGFYVVSVGQEVGIFYHWHEVGERVNGVSGALHKGYKNFQDAIAVYTRNYNLGRLRAVPIPGGPFWPANPSPSTSSVSSTSDDLWAELEDLSEQFNQVVF